MSEEEIPVEKEIREMVDEAKEPGSFNIINVLQERAYPKEKVEVFLDENTAYQASGLKEELDELDKKTQSKNLSANQKQRRDFLISELEKVMESLRANKYIFHIRGISEGARDKFLRDSRKKYPVEYEKSADLAALIGSNAEPKEKPSPERDQFFTDLLWQAHIEKIEDPEGNEQKNLAYNEIRALRDNLPLSSAAKINQSIEKIRTATAVFMMETGEDFLAKP